MMSRFVRPFGTKRYERFYLIAVEGSVTEPGYFDLFDGGVIRVECLYANGESAPPLVLKRMKSRIDRVSMRPGDEAWLVVDKDRWTDGQLNELHTWTQEPHTVKRGLAVSNPKFELWLLLHFEDVAGQQSCSTRLKTHVPGYDKAISGVDFTDERMREAVRRAKEHDTPPCRDWPRTTGTTVYRLVESLMRPPAEVPVE
jgi:hypothetical protein